MSHNQGMPNIASLLKSEIARLARKEVRAQTDALRKATTQYRSEIAALKREVKALQQQVRAVARTGDKVRAQPAAAGGEAGAGKQLRFSATRLAAQRQRLGLSAADFGALVGVTGQSIYKWESGGARPRASQLRAIAEVRGLGKREVQARLAQLRGD